MPIQRIFFLAIVAISSFIFSPAQGIFAETPDHHRLLQLEPLSRSPHSSSPSLKADPVDAPRVRKIEAALRDRQSRPPEMRRDKHVAAIKAKDARTSKLNRERARDIRIHVRSSTGTPQRIRMSPEVKQRGDVLQHAIKGSVPQKELDKATSRAFLRSWSRTLKISDPDRELEVYKYEKDDIGRRYFRYTQKYKGLDVWPAQLNVHLDKNGHVDLMNGSFVPTPRRMVTIPVWAAEAALEQARLTIPGGENATADDPALIIYAPGDHPSRLAWKIRLRASLSADWLVVIDAANGRKLTAYNQVSGINILGSGIDLFGDRKTLYLWQEGGSYYMDDTSKPMFNRNGTIIIRDLDNAELSSLETLNGPIVNSTDPDSGWVPDAVSLAYNLSKTYDYFLQRHNRDSFDGKGQTIQGYTRAGGALKYNAAYSSTFDIFVFGDYYPMAGSLDIVAHEFTHGVTHKSAGLIYQDQPGAINEALSDIFGEMVEARTYSVTDWQVGTALPQPIRCLRDPSRLEITRDTGYYYPSKMSEFYGRDHPLLQMLQDQDHGGVHINNTIIAHSFYLLAEGLPGAIGIRDAENIFYRAKTVHLTKNAQFIDMRLACSDAAEELFGPNAPQVAKVAEAFDAVEIYENAPTPAPSPTIPVNAEDSAMFISFDPEAGGHYLARYDKALGDGALGTWLSCWDVAPSRLSVSGDGSLAFFVDSVQDACFINTQGTSCEECLGFPGLVHSVAMSADKTLLGFILIDDDDAPGNAITVMDTRPGGRTRTFPLVAPTTSGVNLNTVLFADSMTFTSNNRLLIYDAYNEILFQDETRIGTWSIYAIDLLTEETFALVGPFLKANVGYPSLGRTTNHLMTFDFVDMESGKTSIIAFNLNTGEYDVVNTVSGEWTIPGYNGDDRAILYSSPDTTVDTGFSLFMQPLAPNQLTPDGNPGKFVSDADFGVTYRYGKADKKSSSSNSSCFINATLHR